jgi:hypothetical protein
LHHPLVAEQYFDCLTPEAVDMPEKRLMLAVLFDAVLHLHRYRSAEVTRWIRSESMGPFSFNEICETFGIEPQYLARRLLTWTDNGTTAPAGRLRLRRSQRGNTHIAPLRRRRVPATSSAGGADLPPAPAPSRQPTRERAAD